MPSDISFPNFVYSLKAEYKISIQALCLPITRIRKIMSEKSTREKRAVAHQRAQSASAYRIAEKLSSTLIDERERVLSVAENALHMARAQLVLKEYAHAHTLIIEGLDLFRALNLETGVAEALLCLARLYACQREFQLAQRWAEEAIQMYRQAGLLTELAQGLQWLGRICYDLEQYPTAWTAFFEGVETTWKVGQFALCAFYLDWLGIILVAQFRAIACSAEAIPAVHLCTDLPAYDEPHGNAMLLWAVRLWGAAEALRVTEHILPIAEGRPIYTPVVRLVRERLGAEDFDTAWAAGQALSPEQVLDTQAENVSTVRALSATPLLLSQSLPLAKRLTPREIEVLRQITFGLTDAQIAELLVISIHTVNAHTRSIYGKLGVNSRSAATRLAVAHNLI